MSLKVIAESKKLNRCRLLCNNQIVSSSKSNSQCCVTSAGEVFGGSIDRILVSFDRLNEQSSKLVFRSDFDAQLGSGSSPRQLWRFLDLGY